MIKYLKFIINKKIQFEFKSYSNNFFKKDDELDIQSLDVDFQHHNQITIFTNQASVDL